MEENIIYCPGCGQRLDIASVKDHTDLQGYAMCCCPSCNAVVRLGLRRLGRYIDIRIFNPDCLKDGGAARGH